MFPYPLSSFICQAKEQQTSMEERFHNELNAHMKLSNLYKVSLLIPL